MIFYHPFICNKTLLMLQVQLQLQLSLPNFTMFLIKAWRVAAFGVYGYLNFTKSAFLEHSKNFKVEDMRARMDGKNCIVTGANSGIGLSTAEGLASRGASVYMVCRSKERGEAALSKIQSATGNQNVYLEICDLSSVNEIKTLAAKFSSKGIPVHVLVNNAGIMEDKRTLTPDGFEMNFAVNVLGTYTITQSMLPLLEKAAPDSRVITVASGGMYSSPLTSDLQYSEENFDGTMQYARNKRVQVALTEKWAEMYKDKRIGFYAMHPGWAETPGVAKSMPGFADRLSGKLRSSEEGADTVIWLALQPKERLVSGGFYFDRAEAPKHLPFTATAGSHSIIDSIMDALKSLSGIAS
ncbi:uncharacterized protein LOC141605450 [Silene latifolia]|uniref:uncharacterized protein LOC141605450 n=1 Tax=Silene latifolia TaxID=37657 RepID=UPI003D78947B